MTKTISDILKNTYTPILSSSFMLLSTLLCPTCPILIISTYFASALCSLKINLSKYYISNVEIPRDCSGFIFLGFNNI